MLSPNRSSNPQPGRLQQWWNSLMGILQTPMAELARTGDVPAAKDDAKNRLKLVLMHDRTNLSPNLLESMRDELVAVIAKYVEIDEKALELFLEQESNTIALVANISVVRRATGTEDATVVAADPAVVPPITPEISPSSS